MPRFARTPRSQAHGISIGARAMKPRRASVKTLPFSVTRYSVSHKCNAHQTNTASNNANTIAMKSGASDANSATEASDQTTANALIASATPL